MKRSGLVWALLFCLVLVNGLMAAPSVAHAAHHASHHAGTHGTSLCAWLCTAGQGIETSFVVPEGNPLPVNYFVFERKAEILQALLLQAFLRGPPTSLVFS